MFPEGLAHSPWLERKPQVFVIRDAQLREGRHRVARHRAGVERVRIEPARIGLPGQAMPLGLPIEQDFRIAAAIVIAGAEEENGLQGLGSTDTKS